MYAGADATGLDALGCIAAGFGIQAANFWIFCAAALLLGANNAMVMQYRFAAVEYVEPERASKAIAIVMNGALVAAWLGPEIAVRSADQVQTLNDFMVFGAQAVASLMAGVALSTIGWERLNLATLPLLAAALLSLALAARRRRA